MKIALDLDDVLADFTSALMKFYHTKYGKKVSLQDIKIWDWRLYWGISREEAIRRVDEFHEGHSLTEVLPVGGAAESISYLLERKHSLYVITNRPIRFNTLAKSWIKSFLKTDAIPIIHAGDFHKHQAATKSEICRELGISLLIEDSGETALDCANQGIKVILFDKPWNSNFSHSNIFRVSGWTEAISKINILTKP